MNEYYGNISLNYEKGFCGKFAADCRRGVNYLTRGIRVQKIDLRLNFDEFHHLRFFIFFSIFSSQKMVFPSFSRLSRLRSLCAKIVKNRVANVQKLYKIWLFLQNY